jgi:hypothetical protein
VALVVSWPQATESRRRLSHLYHNNRNGTFRDVTVSSGMAREFGPALGVVAADVNGDGWLDPIHGWATPSRS